MQHILYVYEEVGRGGMKELEGELEQSETGRKIRVVHMNAIAHLLTLANIQSGVENVTLLPTSQ